MVSSLFPSLLVFLIFSSYFLTHSNAAGSGSSAAASIPNSRCFSSIPLAWLNDGYCDCVSGEDEPLTGACSNGVNFNSPRPIESVTDATRSYISRPGFLKFQCRDQPIGASNLIPLSHVGDGICDCCDGSDEFIEQINSLTDSSALSSSSSSSCDNICDILSENSLLQWKYEYKIFLRSINLQSNYKSQIELIENSLKSQYLMNKQSYMNIYNRILPWINEYNPLQSLIIAGQKLIPSQQSNYNQLQKQLQSIENEFQQIKSRYGYSGLFILDSDENNIDTMNFEEKKNNPSQHQQQQQKQKKKSSTSAAAAASLLSIRSQFGADSIWLYFFNHCISYVWIQQSHGGFGEEMDDYYRIRLCPLHNLTQISLTKEEKDWEIEKSNRIQLIHSNFIQNQNKQIKMELLNELNEENEENEKYFQLKQSKELNNNNYNNQQNRPFIMGYWNGTIQLMEDEIMKLAIKKIEEENEEEEEEDETTDDGNSDSNDTDDEENEEEEDDISSPEYLNFFNSPTSISSSHYIISYIQGDQCYNGPHRSSIIHYHCGLESKIISIKENGKCSYELLVETPIACRELIEELWDKKLKWAKYELIKRKEKNILLNNNNNNENQKDEL